MGDNRLKMDGTGSMFLDVNPAFFQSIVDYLNDLKISPPDAPPDPPVVDEDDKAFFERLWKIFGMESVYHPFLDSTTLTEPSHVQALREFLLEDGEGGELELLYRASRDGFDAKDFHSKCDNKGATVTVIKDVGGSVFGGFTEESWTSIGGYKCAEKAFLFSLHNHGVLGPVKMRLEESEKNHAMMDRSDYGPSFGGGYDIHVCNQANTNTNSYTYPGFTYELPPGVHGDTFFTGSRHFRAVEIEVFGISRSTARNEACRKRDFGTAQLQQNTEPWETATFDEFPESVKAALRTEQQMLKEVKGELTRLRNAFEQEKELIEFFAIDTSMDIITLNVSGELMSIRKSTLGLVKESVLAKQFNDPLWVKGAGDGVRSVEKWSKEEVATWISKIDGLSEDAAMMLKNQKMNGAELLCLDIDSLKLLGITSTSTLVLLTTEIRKLKKDTGDRVRSVEEWGEEEVSMWISNIIGLSEDAAMILKSHKMNGADLLHLDMNSLKLLGITRIPTLVLLTTEIRKLRRDDQMKGILIEQSAYCFGKILDQLRLHALCRAVHDLTPIPPPIVREPYLNRFKRIVEYYFPSDSSLFE